MIVAVLGKVYEITLGIDIVTALRYLYGYSDGSYDGKYSVLLLGDSLVSTDGKVIGYYEVIKLGLSYGKLFGNIFVNVDGIIFGIDGEN